ncbi:hypothetical protein B0T17DRAFT_494079 [Bombardia bombarda]|uniref:Uncharacterized protein n=1 Tax=Bombardia bombarda TaxID=252184 RepID=A0AA40C171_9PEZI|nr:hypothetical protein B0T17DRAFT_494079 [Bombardia bombarda]
MSAQDRPAAARSSLPSLDDATVPFSALFGDHFDLATVESTTQLADRSIFIAPNGRRYLFASLSDTNAIPAPASATAQTPPRQASLAVGPPQDFRALNTMSIRRRPVSNASSRSPSYSSGPGTAQAEQTIEAVVLATGPKAPTVDDVATSMSHLNVSRFSATPLFGESDGGVQAAEALTDSHIGPRDESSPGSPTPSGADASHQSPPTIYADTSTLNAPHLPTSQITDFDYGSYMAQMNHQAQMSRQAAPAGPSLPSLMEFSSPMSSLQDTSTVYSPWTPVSPEKELAEVQTNGYPPYTSPYISPYNNAQTPPPAPTVVGYQPYANVGRSHSASYFDTQTPIVVHQPYRHPSSASTSDSRSTSRDNVMPGEDLLYDGPVKSAQTLSSPDFQDGQLKVFRNTMTNDLRFHCKVGNDSETYWMKASNAQLVPVYAYDPRFPNVVYIRDNDSEKASKYMQVSPGGGRPSGIYKFDHLKDLCDFQAKLTSEKVVLDIQSVKLVRLSKANTRSSDTYSSVRLQIWHEAELRRSTQSDVASFVTAGTALSGPLRERLVASSSRLIIYLGRLGEFINVFITDDIEIKSEGQTMVKLKARKAGAFTKKGSRWPGVKAHIEPNRGSEPAGLDIDGQAPNVDIETTFDLYKTFEIDFENSPSQDNFLRKWEEVMKERRLQRTKLNQIQEEMEAAVFSGRNARQIW